MERGPCFGYFHGLDKGKKAYPSRSLSTMVGAVRRLRPNPRREMAETSAIGSLLDRGYQQSFTSADLILAPEGGATLKAGTADRRNDLLQQALPPRPQTTALLPECPLRGAFKWV